MCNKNNPKCVRCYVLSYVIFLYKISIKILVMKTWDYFFFLNVFQRKLVMGSAISKSLSLHGVRVLKKV